MLGFLPALIAQSHDLAHPLAVNVKAVDPDKLTNTTVRAAIETLQKGDKEAWASVCASAPHRCSAVQLGRRRGAKPDGD